jgi:hypothetical protein
MSKLPPVRLAQPDDGEAILDMCRRLHAENGLFSLNEDKLRRLIGRYFKREGIIIGVIGKPSELQACTCMQLTDTYYTDDWYLDEMWNYVEPEYRKGTRNAEALLEFCKSCARQMNMPLLTGIITNKNMAKKVRLFRRFLSYPVGATFLYNSSKWKSEPMEDHSSLYQRLREQAKFCATSKSLSKQKIAGLASLLKEAADALSSDHNIWAGKPEENDLNQSLNEHV